MQGSELGGIVGEGILDRCASTTRSTGLCRHGIAEDSLPEVVLPLSLQTTALLVVVGRQGHPTDGHEVGGVEAKAIPRA